MKGKRVEATMIRILYVEDNEHDVLALRRSFKKAGWSFQLNVSDRAESALAILENSLDYDILLVDQGLPGMKGLELCRIVVEREYDLPMVILTGEGSESFAVEALKTGADDYMVKDAQFGYLELLPLVIQDVLKRHENKTARKQAEENTSFS